MLRLPLTVLTVASLSWLGVAAMGDEKPEKADQEAMRLSEEFRKLWLAKDIDGLMKIVEAPFYLGTSSDSAQKTTEVICDRNTITAKLQQSFGGDAPKEVRFEVKRLMSYETLLDELKERLTDEDRKALAKVLKKRDRILFIDVRSGGKREVFWDPPRVTPEGKRLDTMALLVGWRDGKAKVVGVRD